MTLYSKCTRALTFEKLSEADTPAGPASVPGTMAAFALQRHLGSLTGGASVAVKGSCSWVGKALVRSGGGAHGVGAAVKRSTLSGQLSTGKRFSKVCFTVLKSMPYTARRHHARRCRPVGDTVNVL